VYCCGYGDVAGRFGGDGQDGVHLYHRARQRARGRVRLNGENLQVELERVGIGYRYSGEYLAGRPQEPSWRQERRGAGENADDLKLVDFAALLALLDTAAAYLRLDLTRDRDEHRDRR
jgi:hypothetical protein